MAVKVSVIVLLYSENLQSKNVRIFILIVYSFNITKQIFPMMET